MNGQINVIVSRAPDLIPGMVEMVQKVKDPLILVPESFTLTTEQALIQAAPCKGFIGTQVFSTTSLIREIQERAGSPEKGAISSDGRLMVLSLLLMEHRDELKFYKENATQISMAQKLSEQIADLTDGGFDPDMLLDMAEEDRGADRSTSYKLHDIALLWKEYQKVLDKGYADPDTRWNICMERLESSGLMQDMDLLIYGFDYINMNLTRLVLTAYPLVRSVTIGLISDTEHDDRYIFEFASNSVGRFVRRMRDAGRSVHIESYSRGDDHTDAGIRYIERCIFSMQRPKAVPDMSAIHTYYAPNTTAECLYTAQTLIKWHRDGIAWRDMAVAVCDDSTISSMLPLILSSADIPFTHRSGASMMLSEYAQYFVATLRCIRSGYKMEEMLRLIRSGLTGLTEDEIMDMENYVRRYGIDRSKWLRPFKEDEKDKDRAKTAHLEELRQRITEPLAALKKTLSSKRCTGRKAAEDIYEHMISMGIYDTLLTREQEMTDSGEMLGADRNRQVWSAVNDMLDQLASFAGDIHLSPDQLCLMLESSISAKSIKSLPQVADSVVISTPNMFFSPGLRAVAVVGLQDKAASAPSALLTQSECRTLCPDEDSAGIGMTRREAAARAKQDIYQAIACATEQMLFSCSAAQPNGRVLVPSQVFIDVKSMIRDRAPQNDHGGLETDELLPFMPQFALERLAVRLRAAKDGRDAFLTSDDPEDDVWRSSLSYLYSDPKWHDSVVSVLDGLHVSLKGKGIPPQLASRLYGEDRLSVSSIETAGTCLYWAFLSYALKVGQRKEFTFETDSQGTFSHKVLQDYFDAAMKIPEFPMIEDDQVSSIVDGIISDLTQSWEDGPLGKNASSRYRGEEIVDTVRMAVMYMARTLRSVPHFKPIGMEIGFGRMSSEGTPLHFPHVTLELEDGRHITVSGKIDRLDALDMGDGKKALMVYDFKSSDKEIHEEALDAGLQIQLPIYLDAVSKGMPDSIIAGALYQPVMEALAEADDDDSAKIDKGIENKLKSKGIFLDDPLIESACSPVVKTKKKDVLSAVSAEGLTDIIERSKKSAAAIAQRMFSGDTTPCPIKTGDTSPCSYCGMADACPIDPRLE
ncbi:MAG: PD-(D/E)XK nuclease family protein, partial [Oscillospiraceae bacterium]|nr:PD-(D/E)XK nuclease family protein [Oscillospiraceae bacterium]